MDGLNFDVSVRAVQPTGFCKYGHAWTPENTADNGQGYRQCRECKRAANRRLKQRRRDAALQLQPLSRGGIHLARFGNRSALKPIAPHVHPLVRQMIEIVDTRGLVNVDFSVACGYDEKSLSKWRNGVGTPMLHALVDFYNALGYDLVPVKRGKE